MNNYSLKRNRGNPCIIEFFHKINLVHFYEINNNRFLIYAVATLWDSNVFERDYEIRSSEVIYCNVNSGFSSLYLKEELSCKRI